jgi:hypothetical protein
MNAQDLIDTERYPLASPTHPLSIDLVEAGSKAMHDRSLFLLPGFINGRGVQRLTAEVEALPARARQYRREPYSFKPIDVSLPETHPTRRSQSYSLSMLYAEQFNEHAALRQLFGWQPLVDFLQRVVDRSLYCSADPTYSLMTTFIDDGGQHGWHFDSNEFVVSLMLRPAACGGLFEYVPELRSDENENYGQVGAVLDGDRSRVISVPTQAGTLTLFHGHHALHRVSPVSGETSRCMALLSYAEREGQTFNKNRLAGEEI